MSANIDTSNSPAGAGSSPSPLFGWFYRRSKWEPDHVIALCDGHAYLAGRGWKAGSGDMPNLPPADKCCVCMGAATIRRMINAPLKPNEKAQTRVQLNKRMETTDHKQPCACGDCADNRRQSALAAAKELPEARRSAAACSVEVDLTDAEKTALDELCAQKDMTRQGVMLAALRLYQAASLGAAEVTWNPTGLPVGCMGDDCPPNAGSDAPGASASKMKK